MREGRAVSEVVGFVLVFALITSTVGVVYVVGFDGLEDARNAERLNNVERAFDVLADNVEDIHQEGAPSRATELKLADGQLALGPETHVNVSTDTRVLTNQSIRPLVFSSDDTHIAYENGAVLRSQLGGAWMSQAPPFDLREVNGTKRLLFTVVDTNRQGTTGVGGDSTVLVRTVRDDGPNAVQVDTGVTSVVTISLETTTARAAVWRRYFLESEAISEDDVTTDTVSAGRTKVVVTIDDLDRWVVRTVHMDVRFA